ncbi:CvfD/Ygs/GSP13 family RNA-binding post-transcriptional regulator [Facklamia sp. P12945]|uniref:CvfD/Ygs/GSP13 family RNA-binding post-transcriptional regulator n=1 Tax=unclassified Facklamia TaxID=2622293 RepID=UPI003D173DDD
MKFKIGDIIEGEVTGIQNYGIFIKLSDEEQGLVHISECKHGYVGALDEFINIGEKVKVVVIDIDEYSKKISLSMRALDKINTPLFPVRNRRKKRRNLPDIGFKTIADKMPQWIDQAMHSIEENEFNTKIEV